MPLLRMAHTSFTAPFLRGASHAPRAGKTFLYGPGGDLAPRLESKLVHDVLHVTLRSPLGEVERARDLPVAQPARHQLRLQSPCRSASAHCDRARRAAPLTLPGAVAFQASRPSRAPPAPEPWRARLPRRPRGRFRG